MSLEDEEKKDFWDRGVTNHETAMRVGVPRVISYARQWNAIYFTGKYKTWTPLIIAGQHLGFVTPEMKSVIASFPQYFDVNQTSIALKAEFRTVDQRSAAIGSFVEALRVQRTPSDPYFRAFDFWRNEPYDVWGSRHDVPVLTMERSCLCLLGFRHYAVFLNGFVRHPERGLCIWFQQRSMNKTTWPGKWDIMVGAGTTPGNQIIESVIREACEEASLPLAVTDDRVRPAGCVSFFHQDARGVFPNVYHVFDLELGVDDRPVPGDGEAAEFRLLDAQQACDLVFSPRFKMTSRPVAVDFFVRHGILSPDKEPMYAELIEHLHAPMHVPFGCFHPLAIEDVDQSEGIESPSIDSVPV